MTFRVAAACCPGVSALGSLGTAIYRDEMAQAVPSDV